MRIKKKIQKHPSLFTRAELCSAILTELLSNFSETRYLIFKRGKYDPFKKVSITNS